MKVQLSRLASYLRQLRTQDQIIREAGGQEIGVAISAPLIKLFGDINRDFPEIDLSFQGDQRGEALRSQIAVAVQKICERLGEGTTAQVKIPRHPRARPELVFVIHGQGTVADIRDNARDLGVRVRRLQPLVYVSRRAVIFDCPNPRSFGTGPSRKSLEPFL
jgi:hypothetical protein